MHQNFAFLLSSSQLPAVKKATFWFIPIPKQILGPSYFASAFFRPKTKVWSPNSLVSCSIMYPSCYTYLYVFTCIFPQSVFNLNKSWEKSILLILYFIWKHLQSLLNIHFPHISIYLGCRSKAEISSK